DDKDSARENPLGLFKQCLCSGASRKRRGAKLSLGSRDHFQRACADRPGGTENGDVSGWLRHFSLGETSAAADARTANCIHRVDKHAGGPASPPASRFTAALPQPPTPRT